MTSFLSHLLQYASSGFRAKSNMSKGNKTIFAVLEIITVGVFYAILAGKLIPAKLHRHSHLF